MGQRLDKSEMESEYICLQPPLCLRLKIVLEGIK